MVTPWRAPTINDRVMAMIDAIHLAKGLAMEHALLQSAKLSLIFAYATVRASWSGCYAFVCGAGDKPFSADRLDSTEATNSSAPGACCQYCAFCCQ